MALLDFEGVQAQEFEARRGKADALYALGLAYSTGQGVELDMVAAHKWFNLAAMKGVAEAREKRAEIGAEIGPIGVAQAQKLARAWLSQLH